MTADSFDSKAASIYELLLTERHHRHLRMSDVHVQSQSSLRLFTPLSCDDAIKLVRSASAKQKQSIVKHYKKAVLPQGNRAMLQVFFSVEVRQQHSLQV